MTENEALAKMVPPNQHRPGKPRGGVIQIWITRACDKACFGCTQGSNLGGKPGMMSVDQFELACQSLKGYFGIVGVFGGNPALNPFFPEICGVLRKHFPKDQCGLWCNHPKGHGRVMRRTFSPAVSNLNVHLDKEAYREFRLTWPESRPFGLTQDSRHSPPYVAMKDVLKKECGICDGDGINPDSDEEDECGYCDGTGKIYDESKAWELISNCDINQHWSAMIGVFRGEMRAWFCEIAGAQAMLHQHEPDYPDTGHPIGYLGEPHEYQWWQRPMTDFRNQVRHHCHSCGVPLRGHGELAQGDSGTEQVSATHANVYKTKVKGRPVQVVTNLVQLGPPLAKMTDYIGNAKR